VAVVRQEVSAVDDERNVVEATVHLAQAREFGDRREGVGHPAVAPAVVHLVAEPLVRRQCRLLVDVDTHQLGHQAEMDDADHAGDAGEGIAHDLRAAFVRGQATAHEVHICYRHIEPLEAPDDARPVHRGLGRIPLSDLAVLVGDACRLLVGFTQLGAVQSAGIARRIPRHLGR